MAAGTGIREERKLKTRQALLDAALKLLEGEQSFSSLSLREVTREAGVVPTAFYRHFRDMDELGLALVDESVRTLRQVTRAARQGTLPTEQIIRRSVETIVAYVQANRLHFQFLMRERAGGRSQVRSAIRSEVRLFISELATDLARFPGLREWSTEDLQMMAGTLVGVVINALQDVLELPPGRSAEELALVEMVSKQLRLVILGAGLWKSRPPEVSG
jgi:AcrR family transcriptional regulator